MNNRVFFQFAFIFLFSALLFPEAPLYRYGIFVSSSKGFNENRLDNAGKQVQKTAALFREYCRLDETVILEDPDIQALSSAFEAARESIAGQRGGQESQLFVYYYGHGLPDGLLLNSEIYRKELLKRMVDSVEADMRFVFLDACSSQVLSSAESLDFRTESKGTVYITSSTQFQKAYAGLFTPILKAGLMGDADGFIPLKIDTAFLYSKITAKLPPAEMRQVRSLYGVREYYQYRESSERDRLRVKGFFSALGMDSIPEDIHITDLEEGILRQVSHPLDEEAILNSYDYSRICTLKSELSPAEKESLLANMEKVGFKRDNYVTLSELFSYIQSRVAERELNGQRATITTDYLSFNESVPLSYFDSKVNLRLAYPGTILIMKVNEDGLLEDILKLIPGLDEGAPLNLALSPGRYKVGVERAETRYEVEFELKAGDEPLTLKRLEWDNMTAYRLDGRWQSKAGIDRRLRVSKRTAWIAPTFTFTSLAAPLSLIFTGAYFNYSANLLHTKYTASTDSMELLRIREQELYHREIRDALYIAGAICFSVPITLFVVWMVRIGQMRRLNLEIKRLKRRFGFDYLPEVSMGGGDLILAFNIKI